MTMRSGPMPSSDELIGYAAADPSLPNRIATMAEREAAHRHEMDREQSSQRRYVITKDARLATAGLIAGVLLIGGSLAASAYFFLHGNTIAGVTFAGTPVLGTAIAVVRVTAAKKRERDDPAADD
jgi:uncharacterized membrane protein